MDERPLVGIFIPCYNEGESIAAAIQAVDKYLSSDAFPYEGVIIVVDDGSTDDSYRIAREAGADVLYRHVRNQGLGAATRSGMEIAHYIGCDAFAKFDADLQHDVNDIHEAVRPLVEDKADILYASRFTGDIRYRMPLVRLLGNRFFTWLMRRLTGWPITDGQTGLMCFGRRYLTIFEIPGPYNPPQQALFDAARKGMRYAEVPATFHQRTTGASFVGARYIYKVFSSLAKISFYHYGIYASATLGAVLLLIGAGAIAQGLWEYFVLGAPSYVRHGTLVVLSLSIGVFSILFGLQSFALLGRMPYVRNGGSYRYIIVEDIVVLSPSKVRLARGGPQLSPRADR